MLQEKIVRPFDFGRRFDLEGMRASDRETVLEQEREAREEEERVAAEREAIGAVARAQGFEEGMAAARLERDSEVLRMGAELNAALARSFAQAGDFQGQLTVDAVALAVAIGEGLAGELIKRSPLGAAETSISKALIEQFERPKLTVKVNAADQEHLKAFIDEQVQLVGFEGRLHIQPDETLSRGDCIIEWSDGGIRSIFSERRERVIGQLLEILDAKRSGE